MKLDEHDREVNLYKFYKSPDGEDCLEKTYYYTKYGAVGGAVFSFYEMVIVSKPVTIYAALARLGRFTFPVAGMGFAFGSTICILGHMRGKSDHVNHLIAGGIAGAVWGAKYQSIAIGHRAAIMIGFMAAYTKYFDYHKIPIFAGTSRTPEMRHNIPNMDFTIKTYDDPGRPDRA